MNKLIIIPAYNEEESIIDTVKAVKAKSPDFDIVVINDCSTDATRKICIANNINFVDSPINLGIGGAVQTGYRYALEFGYDIAVQVDADGQHNPEFLKIMAEELENTDAAMVIGSRFIDNEGFQSTFARRLGIRFFTALIKMLTGKTITDPTSGLRMVGKKGIEIFAKDYPNDYPEPETAVALLVRGMDIIEIPVIMNERQGGVSSINIVKSVYYMVKVTIAILVEASRGRMYNGID